jgi:hypothetical protein
VAEPSVSAISAFHRWGSRSEFLAPDGAWHVPGTSHDGRARASSDRQEAWLTRSSREDIEATVRRLRDAVEVGDIERDDWGIACEFVDPDGYRLHPFQPPLQMFGGDQEPL